MGIEGPRVMRAKAMSRLQAGKRKEERLQAKSPHGFLA
jgi:hypothetical protein